MQITLRFEDLQTAERYLGPGDWSGDYLEVEDGVVRQEWSEANYAARDERLELAKTGIPFYGMHGAGGDYGLYRFAAYDGKMMEWPTNCEWTLVVCAELGVDLEEAERVLAYIEFEQEAMRRTHGK
jgi:hypothetical protein